MIQTKNTILQFVLNERVQTNSSIIAIFSIVGVVILGVLQFFTPITIPSVIEYIVGAPLILALLATVFIGGPILFLMAEYSDHYRDGQRVMRGMGMLLTFTASLAILSRIEEYLYVVKINTLPTALHFSVYIVLILLIAVIYHALVKGLIKKIVQL